MAITFNRIVITLSTLIVFVISPGVLANDEYIIKNVQVLSFTQQKFLPPMDVAVANGKIVAIEDTIESKTALVIDGSHKYLVPGFTEMHAHIPPQNVKAADVEDLLFLYSAYGITTVRGMLGHPSHLILRKQLQSNQAKGPRLITSGPSFHGNSITSAEQAKEVVKQQFEMGYDFIKIHPGLSAEAFNAMATQANGYRLPFAGHVTASVGVIKSIEAGQASIDHIDGVLEELAKRSGAQPQTDTGFFGSALVNAIDEKQIAPLAQQIAASGVAIVPTETLMYGFLSWQSADASAQKNVAQLMPQDIVDGWKRSRQAMQNADWYSPENVQKLLMIRRKFLNEFINNNGVMLLGSDAPQVFNVPGDSLHEEMQLMKQVGLTPLQVLYSASLGPAKYFGKDNEFGQISKGFSADFVLLEKDPLADIGNTRAIAGVMTRGQWLERSVIDGRLQEINNKNKANQ
ncbi:amidohydrolase family protein [Thalassotalea sp. PS06]|uniref:amidohydrolase family protein n=1 Tax=Thalassotalea sp. PS06 TaxID=2594005 RepID=UPI0011656CAB|nr:amidohydrolase family protein [Thalassotalea sp. PS06]QDP01300.1 amidohydrolase family protein [Thalassotalea sp. PS06]